MGFLESVDSARRGEHSRRAEAAHLVPVLHAPVAAPTKPSRDHLDELASYIPEIALSVRAITRAQLAARVPAHTDCLSLTEFLKQVRPPDFERTRGAANMLVFGIFAGKSSVRTSVQGHKYLACTMCDLRYDVALQLYDDAFTKLYKLQPGTVVGIFNPRVFPLRERGLRAPGFNVRDADSIVELGTARDFGTCEARTRASNFGKACTNWVDLRKSRVCDFHTEQTVRTKRPELNHAQAKLFDPRTAANGRRLAVVHGGAVKWKRGLQPDGQSPRPGRADGPSGRVFQSAGFDPSKFDESFSARGRRLQMDRQLLKTVGEENELRRQLERDAVVRKRVEDKLGLPPLKRKNRPAEVVDPIGGRRPVAAGGDSDSDLEIVDE